MLKRFLAATGLVVALAVVTLVVYALQRTKRVETDPMAVHASLTASRPDGFVVGVQLPNPGTLGKRTSEAVPLLLDRKPGDAEPMVIWSDVLCGKYIGASAYYRRPATLAIVRAEVGRIYGPEHVPASGKPIGIWRVEKPQLFSIFTDEEHRADEDLVVVRYISQDPEIQKCADSEQADTKP